MQEPDYSIEFTCGGIVAGVDEAGRGPWAGPVVAAAAIINPDTLPRGINDSKKLSPKTREAMFNTILATTQTGIGMASVEEIDALNILAATKLAMQRAVEALPIKPDVALVDGNQPPKLCCQTRAIIKGDSKSLSIATASIIAKVTRDRLMAELALAYPGYGWEKNAGYGVKAHQDAIAALGITPHHRKSFAPIRAYLERAA